MPDNLLVNRDGQTYQVDMENTKSIQDTDLLLVNRNGTTYTVAGSEISRGDFSEVVITPTSIVPETSEQLLTAVTDIPKVGSDVPADVFWTWYQYDSATGTAGQKVLKTLTNREASDTLVLSASSAGKFIGCTVTYLAVAISETERCAVGTPPGPVAVMNGLRFDSNRQTYMDSSIDGAKGTTKFTHSFWMKPTGRMRFLFNTDAVPGVSETVWETNSNRFYFGTGGSAKLNPTNQVELNKWQHVVLSNDPEGECAIYLNGEKISSDSGVASLEWNGSPLRIGRNNSGGDSDGYMSDVYFVTDQCLPPTFFGKQFPEGWGPIDSSVVKDNIASLVQPPEQIQPYDTRPNTDSLWSSQCVGTGQQGTDPTYAFNGTTEDNWVVTDNTTAVWNCAFTDVTKFEIQLRADGIQAQIPDYAFLTISGDGIETTQVKNISSFQEIALTSTSPGQITVSGMEGVVSAGIAGIKINGRYLVDQGVWDTSQNWTGGAGNSSVRQQNYSRCLQRH